MKTPEVTVAPDEEGDGATLQVPDKRVARLLQLGVAAERKEIHRNTRRRMAKQSRKRNR